MAIPFARWGARPFIVHPIAFPATCRDVELEDRNFESAVNTSSRNPIQVALEWRQMLAADNTLTMAQIARNTGLSRARITQVMKLLALPQEVITYMENMTNRNDLRLFSERKLKEVLAAGSPSAQLSKFYQIRNQSHRQ